MIAYMLLWTSLWGSSKLVPAVPDEAIVLKSVTDDKTRYCSFFVRLPMEAARRGSSMTYDLVFEGTWIRAQLLVHDGELINPL